MARALDTRRPWPAQPRRLPMPQRDGLAAHRRATVPFWPGALMTAALMYNAALCLVNAQVHPLTQAAVVAVELCIVAAAHLVALLAYRPQMRPWYVLIVFLFCFAMFRTVGMESVEVRYFRDGLIIPTFVLLGMTIDRREFVRWLIVVHTLTLALMFYEALATESFAALFNIKEYYINTRGYKAEDFWNTGSTLFVSASRPNERIYFAFLNLHRVSSVFLEPVSLGNYCVIVTAILCALYRSFNWATRLYLGVGNFMLIVACDGRLAVMSSILILAVSLCIRFVPRRITVLYLPVTIMLASAVVIYAHLPAGGDDFPGRVAHTVRLLFGYGTLDFLGLSDQYLSKAVDSGVAYLIITQSILGLVVIWCFIVFCAKEETYAQRSYIHGVCLYIVTNMLVSFAFLTIKTAALLWVVYGMLQMWGREERGSGALPAAEPIA